MLKLLRTHHTTYTNIHHSGERLYGKFSICIQIKNWTIKIQQKKGGMITIECIFTPVCIQTIYLFSKKNFHSSFSFSCFSHFNFGLVCCSPGYKTNKQFSTLIFFILPYFTRFFYRPPLKITTIWIVLKVRNNKLISKSVGWEFVICHKTRSRFWGGTSGGKTKFYSMQHLSHTFNFIFF